ncbi:DUF6455 family protein [Tropicibacter naphthalenivorans]|uniref:DUF6455 domain-containing protein n=1 Tax=Tropicibacter naphthalenivorans TaxID=441103 RepID=A0A0P1GEA2_9RHOB|nr:DUF6455 family protein [Tropicibacter naphthalenivorans]CUH74683.1 hypothetical protein TRN7648_00027 [Tropicibacter naphthalenivorans]SMC49858.1 hypothetical protein SAMN04488093_101853 [Tropicibacter naphthalenivorans]
MIRHLGDPARHFFMTRSVARVMGLSLSDEMNEGRLAPEAYAGMVTCCRGCALVEACQEWLSRQVPGSASAPPGCCNAALLTELKKMH